MATPCAIVRVDDVRLQPLHDARQPPRRRQIHLGARRERDELEAFRRAPPQLAVGMRDQRRALPDLAQAVDGQQHLVLAAAPRPGGIDVEENIDRVERVRVRGRHEVRVRVFVRFEPNVQRCEPDACCSSHSFANFRNT
mgnify:CR=1 FL=1